MVSGWRPWRSDSLICWCWVYVWSWCGVEVCGMHVTEWRRQEIFHMLFLAEFQQVWQAESCDCPITDYRFQYPSLGPVLAIPHAFVVHLQLLYHSVTCMPQTSASHFKHRLHLNRSHHQTSAASNCLPFTLLHLIFHFCFILLFYILILGPKSSNKQTSVRFHWTPTQIYLLIYTVKLLVVT